MKQFFKRAKTFTVLLNNFNCSPYSWVAAQEQQNRERVWKKISSSCRKYAMVAVEEKRSLNSPFIRIKILSLNTVLLW